MPDSKGAEQCSCKAQRERLTLRGQDDVVAVVSPVCGCCRHALSAYAPSSKLPSSHFYSHPPLSMVRKSFRFIFFLGAMLGRCAWCWRKSSACYAVLYAVFYCWLPRVLKCGVVQRCTSSSFARPSPRRAQNFRTSSFTLLRDNRHGLLDIDYVQC